ncbi:TPA: response regulator transcription factor [Streptococcus suis]
MDDICKQTFVSKRTVSNHLSNIFSKLGVTNRQEAVHVAEQIGYFPPE